MISWKLNRKGKKKALQVAKYLVTGSLCLFIILNGDWAQIRKQWQNANLVLLLAVFGSMVFCVTISAIKWKLLLSIHGIFFKLKELHHYYFVALFINNFLPSSIGGDVYRIYKTFNNEKSGVSAIIAVLLERVTGIWALLFLGFIGGIVLLIRTAAEVPFLKTMTIVFAVGVILPVILTITAPFIYRKSLGMKFIPEKLRLLLNYITSHRYSPAKMLNVILISFFFQIFSIEWAIMLFKAIGVDFPFFKMAVTSSVSNTAAIIPLSINGIGLLDGSFIYVSALFAIKYSDALTYLLFMRAFTLIISLVGGLMYLWERNEFRKYKESVSSD